MQLYIPCFSFLLLSLTAIAQEENTVELFKGVEILDSLKIPIESRVTYRYPTCNYEDRNIKLTQIKDRVLRDSIDDKGNVLSRTECRISVYPQYFSLSGNYILRSQTYGDILGQDTTYPSDIVTYRFQIVPNGKFREFYPNGIVKTKGRYWGSQQVGKWNHYYHNGIKYKTESYQKPWNLRWDNKRHNRKNARLLDQSTS